MKSPLCIQKAMYNERGMALIIVLLVLTVLSVLGLAILGLSLNNMKANQTEQKYEAAYYIAEAGAAKAYTKIKNIAEDLHQDHFYREEPNQALFYSDLEQQILGGDPYSSPVFEKAYGEIPSAEIAVQGSGGNYMITSMGKIGNQKREVRQAISVNWSSGGGPGTPDSSKYSKETALIIKSTLDIGGNVTINGDVWIGDKANLKIGGSSEITGNVYSLSETNQAIPEFPVFPQKPALEEAEDYKVNKNKELLLSKNVSYFNLFQVSGSIVTINTGESDKEIVVNNLNLGKDGQIYIKGTGKLTIYVSGAFTMDNKSTINDNTKQPEKLKIYWKGSGILSLQNNHQEIYGLLYAENGTIDLNGGLIKGTIVADKFISRGNATVEHGTELPFTNDNSNLSLPPNGIVNPSSIREKE
ncbi:DUF7305 domain-containing protein [Domibacillus mangrovi]|uniref:Type 4 fimbrial biogenesis protein PilX N-terminal domain-containing protein n=1 Tax=Domibacillus mangrovi TaxID=1714354 RepID=A0A1Q5P7U6_9BACI|nr:collagen-binding domain-containing protein [Domibacillus mangrovi]OKL38253.1 hypothetical protein BLL40_02185 [Domibacillus mangrovi]